jgi:hypothetical protein
MRWDKEVEALKDLSIDNKISDIARIYGVSRQRMFQVFTKYGIETPEKKRKNFLRDKPIKFYWANRMLSRYKTISKADRLSFLNEENIPNYCPILDVELNYNSDKEFVGWTRKDDSPSIDRIDNTLGYVIGNIHIISWRANRIKNDGTAEEHRLIYEYLINLK